MKTGKSVSSVLCALILAAVLLFSCSFTAFAADEIEESWFNDAFFLGDSLTGSLGTYCMVNGGLGDALIVHMNGLACHNIVDRDFEISLMGKTYPVEDAVKASGAKKLFLMLAMNDIGLPVDDLKADWVTLLGRFREKNPDLEIYIQSGTPVIEDNLYFTKKNMLEYNEMLKKLCEEENCTYVDVTDGLKNEDGFLKKDFQMEYTNDSVHMNFEGCAVWVSNLRNPLSYAEPGKNEE